MIDVDLKSDKLAVVSGYLHDADFDPEALAWDSRARVVSLPVFRIGYEFETAGTGLIGRRSYHYPSVPAVVRVTSAGEPVLTRAPSPGGFIPEELARVTVDGGVLRLEGIEVDIAIEVDASSSLPIEDVGEPDYSRASTSYGRIFHGLEDVDLLRRDA